MTILHVHVCILLQHASVSKAVCQLHYLIHSVPGNAFSSRSMKYVQMVLRYV